MDKVLIITYYWPPGSGAGVQRWLKFAKYLPAFSIEPVILTVDPEFAAYPATDKSLETEISPGLKIYKTRATDYFRIYKPDKRKIPSAGFANSEKSRIKDKITRFIRGNFFIPDPRKGWNKYAFRKACEIIVNEDVKHIITTSPPHSTQLIGLKLKKKYPDIKWIADLRDPWMDIYYYNQFYPTFISRKIDKSFELQVLKSADKIITVGKSLRDLLINKLFGIENKTEVITNGFDEDDFIGLKRINPAKLTISYIGTLSDAYPIGGFLSALQSLKEKNIDFKLKFVGTVSPKQKVLILSGIEKSSVDFIPYVDHSIAITHMIGTTVLLLIIPDHQSNKSIITGKLFEYIASGKPVLCLGPTDGDAAEIIKDAGNGSTFKYDDSLGIRDFLTSIIENPVNIDGHNISSYNRKNLTSKLVKVLKEI